jgi:hypothetical protein
MAYTTENEALSDWLKVNEDDLAAMPPKSVDRHWLEGAFRAGWRARRPDYLPDTPVTRPVPEVGL